MSLSKEEKQNILIAAVLSAAAVFVFYWVRPTQQVYQADPAELPVRDTSGTANPAALPNYMNYNVPPYNPGALPPINNINGGSTYLDYDNSGAGCCPGCAGDDQGITSNIGSFLSRMGLGSYGGSTLADALI